jgi:outer membrane protein OmpA-like peptidoglycan-associated protein
MKLSIRFVPTLCMLLIGHLTSYSQNLVANGSFEDENLCTEYQKYCAPEAWIATSGWANYLFKEMQHAYDGYHYVGLTVGSVGKQGVRNFIRTRLLCGLRKGRQYKVEMYVCSSNKVLDSIGVYFSQQDFLYEKRNFKSIQPVFWYQRPRNSAGQEPWAWQKLSFVYTASGDESYLVIGSFKRFDFKGITRPDFQDDYYFYLDKVSLTPVDPNEKLCPLTDVEKMRLYKENDRHELIEKRIRNYHKNPTASREQGSKLPLTRIPGVLHIDTLVIPDIFFVTASYELSKKSFVLLDSFALQIKGLIDSIVIKGHTDSIGMLDYNKELSLNRAISVKQYLVSKINVLGVPVMARGYAYSQPVASNRTQSGRKKNRRVEIFIYRKD